MTTSETGRDGAQPSSGDEQSTLTLGERVRQPQTVLSFLFAVLIVAFLVRRLDIDLGQVWRELRSANLALFALGAAVFYLGFILRVLRWRRMLVQAGVDAYPEVRLPSNGGLLEIMLLAWFANCVVPAKLGDIYRGFLLKRRSEAPFTTTMGTIAAERLIDLVMLVVLLVISGLIVFGRHFPSGTGRVLVYGGATVLVGVVGVVTVWVFRDHIVERLPARVAGPVNRIQTGLFDNLRNPWSAIGISLVIWLGEGVRFFLVAWSLDARLALSTALFMALLGSLATVSPITPAGLGVVEAIVISVLPLVGVNEDSAAAIVILDRIIAYWSLIAIGIPLYIFHVRRDVAAAVQQEPSSA